jgi:hypothetical protein
MSGGTIVHSFRQSDGSWSSVVEVEGIEATLPISAINIQLRLADLYDRLDFKTPASVVL